MRRSRLIAAAAVIGVAGFTAAATAGDHKRGFETDMLGYEEVPSVSTIGGGQVDAEINRDGTSIHYRLQYRNLEGNVLQSHIHLGQKDANGAIVVFLCTNLGNGPAGRATPACPPAPATVEGDLTKEDVSTAPAPANAINQGIAAQEFDELVRAMRAGVTYANVHSSKFPGGEIRGQFDLQGHQDD